MKDETAISAAIRPILKRLNSFSSDISASAVMSRDGRSLATAIGEGVDSERLGAMCATMLSLGEKASHELKRGNLKMVLIHGEDGYVVLLRIAEKAVLTVVSLPSAHLGMMLIEAKKTVADIIALKVL